MKRQIDEKSSSGGVPCELSRAYIISKGKIWQNDKWKTTTPTAVLPAMHSAVIGWLNASQGPGGRYEMWRSKLLWLIWSYNPLPLARPGGPKCNLLSEQGDILQRTVLFVQFQHVIPPACACYSWDDPRPARASHGWSIQKAGPGKLCLLTPKSQSIINI